MGSMADLTVLRRQRRRQLYSSGQFLWQSWIVCVMILGSLVVLLIAILAIGI